MGVCFSGIDVGGRRKGFHAAVVDGNSLLAGPARLGTPAEAAEWVAALDPKLVGVDSPCRAAPPGQTTRDCERALARSVCGIRWTPEASRLGGNPYYEWIVHGLELYAELDRSGLEAIEVFPTATWTRLAGKRGTATRARWSSAALASFGLVLPRLNQDGRDAIGAAITARLAAEGRAQQFGEIWVPA